MYIRNCQECKIHCSSRIGTGCGASSGAITNCSTASSPIVKWRNGSARHASLNRNPHRNLNLNLNLNLNPHLNLNLNLKLTQISK